MRMLKTLSEVYLLQYRYIVSLISHRGSMHRPKQLTIGLGEGTICIIDPVSLQKLSNLKPPTKSENHWLSINSPGLVSPSQAEVNFYEIAVREKK